jgi:hypothetical protein
MKGQVIITVMGLTMAVSPAIAQNHCSEVLSQGIWNSTDISNSASSRQDVANWACSNSRRAGEVDLVVGELVLICPANRLVPQTSLSDAVLSSAS